MKLGYELHQASKPASDRLLIGINRAALAYRLDVWACLDLPAVEKWHAGAIGSPQLLIGREAETDLAARGIVWRGEVFHQHLLRGLVHPNIQWDLFSFTTAIVYAVSWGATRIDVVGCDWDGTADYDGVQAGGNRSDARWALERSIYGVLKQELAGHAEINRTIFQ